MTTQVLHGHAATQDEAEDSTQLEERQHQRQETHLILLTEMAGGTVQIGNCYR
jgi:hypothetical protein